MNNIIFKTTFLKGEDGNNILRIDKTATSGLVDTYTITLTDGTTTTFNVTNGSSIATIEKTATVGMVDTYTITLTDGSTSTFEVTNGANVTIDDQLDVNSTNPVENRVVTGAISGLSTAVSNISNNLNGFTFYPAGEVDLVASVSDDSYYTDANGKYVLADSPTGESLIDDITYKSLASNEDLRGEVGADTVVPFKSVDTSYIDTVYKTFAPIDSSGRGQAGYTFTLNLTHTRELLVMESLKEGSISFSVASSECTVTEIFTRPNSFATSMFCIYLIEGKIGQSYTAYTNNSNGIPILTRFALHNNYNINLAFQDLVQNKSFNLTTKKALVLLANFNAGGNPTCASDDANITLLFGNIIQYCKVYIYYVEGEIGDLIVSNTNGGYPATVILNLT